MVKWQHKLLHLSQSLAVHDKDILQKIANATISICGKSRRWDWSLHLFSDMKRCQSMGCSHGNPATLPPRDVISYGTLISMFGKLSQWQRALLLLCECDTLADLTPDQVCFNAAIDACGRGLQWLRASKLLLAMLERSVLPDIVGMSTLMAALSRASCWQQALSAFSKAHASHMRLDILGMTSAISAYEKGRHWKAALELLVQASRKQAIPDTVGFGAAIVACEGCSQWEQALNLLMHIVPPSRARNASMASCYATAMKAVATAKRWQHALALLTGAQSYGDDFIDSFAWASLFSALLVNPNRLYTETMLLYKQGIFRNVRQSAQLADIHCLAEWMQGMGVNGFVARYSRRKGRVLGQSPSETFAADMLETEGWAQRARVK
ncbi:unnamed protein product [Durusdinium trenchii]|uniref:Pentatricopeptide repeat-containing protein, chloroplastic n=1 Tax=Durusdinium trenchii TaxID=1381693 RepID=A0ABP0JDH5_9DINO